MEMVYICATFLYVIGIYEEYKKNGFKVNKLGDYDLTLDFDKKPE